MSCITLQDYKMEGNAFVHQYQFRNTRLAQ